MWWSVWGGDGGAEKWQSWAEGGGWWVCAHSVSDTFPPQTDCLFLLVMGTVLKHIFPPSSAHTLYHDLRLSLSSVAILLVCLYFSAEIFAKLPAFWCLSIHPFLCIISNQSASLWNWWLFAKLCVLLISHTAQSERRKNGKKQKKRDQSGRREYQWSSVGTFGSCFFFSWQQQSCITKEPIYPLSNMLLCANPTTMQPYFRTHRLTEAQKNFLYLNAQAPTLSYLKQIFWSKLRHVAFLKCNQQQVCDSVRQ